jgi:hypothetical protein
MSGSSQRENTSTELGIQIFRNSNFGLKQMGGCQVANHMTEFGIIQFGLK